MSNIITSGTTFQNDLITANTAAVAAVTAARSANISAFDARSFAQQANLSAIRAANSATQASNSASLAATYATAARTATGNVTTTNVTNQPAGSAGWVQISSGNGFTGSSNLTFVNNSLNVLGTLRSFTANIPSIVSTQINASSISANYVSSNAISVFGNSSFTQNLNIFGSLSVVGTISGNGASLSGVAPINSPVFTGVPSAPTAGFGTSTTQIATTQFVNQAIANFTGVSGNSFSVTGNIVTSNNVIASGVLTAIGNVTGGNLRTTGVITATGNITTAGNLVVAGAIQSSGNVTLGNVISGNIQAGNVRTIGLITATGNLTSGNIITGNVTANGAVQAINANVTNTLSVSGGIKQNQFTKLGSSAGQPGQIVWDTNYIYVCTATNVWKRVALSSF